MLPSVPFKPLRRKLKEVTRAKGELKQRVGFFLGCADDLVFNSAGSATVSLLSDNACEVVIPARLECCGMPCLGYGEMEQAIKLAKNNIEAFEAAQVEYIITDCGTCGSFLKGYSDLLKGQPQYAERAEKFSQKIRDISEFLVERIDRKSITGEIRGKVTYHDSCHMRWVQKVSSQPRQILELIPGLELVEMREADTCCGGAGSYNLTHYKASMGILDRKMSNIAATGADLVATGCPGCRIQLRLGVKRRSLKGQVVHPVELLRQAYRR
jgi:glycolate oxidase iron-sulfur subunit